MQVLTKDAIRGDVLRIIRELRDDWDWSGEITDDTGLFRQLGFESIDVVALGSTLEEWFNRTLPFADFLTKARERDAQDITVGELLAFLADNLLTSSVAPTA